MKAKELIILGLAALMLPWLLLDWVTGAQPHTVQAQVGCETPNPTATFPPTITPQPTVTASPPPPTGTNLIVNPWFCDLLDWWEVPNLPTWGTGQPKASNPGPCDRAIRVYHTTHQSGVWHTVEQKIVDMSTISSVRLRYWYVSLSGGEGEVNIYTNTGALVGSSSWGGHLRNWQQTDWLAYDLPPGTDSITVELRGRYVGATGGVKITGVELEAVEAGTGDMTFTSYVLGTNPIGLWPLDETSGTTADNAEGTAARDGTFSGVTLDNTDGPFSEGRAGLFGTLDYVNIYSTSLNSALNGSEGSFVIWAKVLNSGVWSDNQVRTIFSVSSDTAGNYFQVFKTTGNDLRMRYSAGATLETYTTSGFTSTDWFLVAVTWSATQDRVRFYLNGDLLSTSTGLGTWAGDLDSTATVIGALDNLGSAGSWSGWLMYGGVWDTELAGSDISNFYNYPPAATAATWTLDARSGAWTVPTRTQAATLSSRASGWTLGTRSTSLTADSRSMGWTLPALAAAWTVSAAKTVALTLPARSTALTVDDRGLAWTLASGRRSWTLDARSAALTLPEDDR